MGSNMKIKSILCPIDFSEFNQAANEYASMLAESTGAEIIYLHAFLLDPYEPPQNYFDPDAYKNELIEKMKEFIQPVKDGIPTTYVVEMGIVIDRIIDFANQQDIDIVVIGTHGRTGMHRLLMGSVAEAVIRGAECPVLAVKTQPQPAKVA